MSEAVAAWLPHWPAEAWWGIGLTVLGILLAVIFWARPRSIRSSVIHWVRPTWKLGTEMVRTKRIPVLTVRWSLRGIGAIQGLECWTKAPGQDWRKLAHPKGTVTAPKDGFMTHVNLIDGRPFNSVVYSPVDYGKPVTDATGQRVNGTYKLRLDWSDADKPTKRRRVEFKHKVKADD